MGSISASTGAGGKLLLVILVGVSGLILTHSDILTAHGPLAEAMPPLSLAALASLLIVNVLFLFLLGARTPLGRRRMDEIEGLRTYLKAAEEDRMNMAGAPEMPPQQYETLLPYAVALDAERPWSESFQTWLTAATAVGATSASDYDGPSWYGGDRDFSIDDIGSTMSNLSRDLSESMTASLPTPDHASSGLSGGGDASRSFSGGGGGGGWQVGPGRRISRACMFGTIGLRPDSQVASRSRETGRGSKGDEEVSQVETRPPDRWMSGSRI